MSFRWRRRPAGSNWGEFGANDQLGRLNLITAKKVLEGVAEVREGRVFCLSLPLDIPGGNVLSPGRLPPVLRPTLRNGRVRMNLLASEENPGSIDVGSDDLVVLHTQYSTHWDSFAHFGQVFDVDDNGIPQPVYYNGFRAGSDIIGPTDPADAGASGVIGSHSTCCANALGIEHIALSGVQGRGVLIDLHAHFGRNYIPVNYDALMAVLRSDNVKVEPGDIVCLHTGYAETLLEMRGRPDPATVHSLCTGLDGRDHRLLDWITDSGIAALVADNIAVEHFPALAGTGQCSRFPMHEHCLFKLGIPLGELWYLTELAGWLRPRGSSRFLLTAPPLRLPGAVGSPATPIATV